MDADPIANIESSMLAAATRLLDGLIDSAALARPGVDAEVHAAALRTTARQMSGLGDLLESVGSLAQAPVPAARRMSA